MDLQLRAGKAFQPDDGQPRQKTAAQGRGLVTHRRRFGQTGGQGHTQQFPQRREVVVGRPAVKRNQFLRDGGPGVDHLENRHGLIRQAGLQRLEQPEQHADGGTPVEDHLDRRAGAGRLRQMLRNLVGEGLLQRQRQDDFGVKLQ